MVTLQQHFSSMEETVRTLLQNQDSLEGPKVDPLDLMKAYKDKLLEEMWKQQDSLEAPAATVVETPGSPEADGGSEENPKDGNPLLERLRALEAENSALSMENDNQRKQYERCLDEVANQVVQALLTQKDLKEECVKLRTRVFDLEQQNRILSLLFQQRVKMSPTPVSQEVQRNGKAAIPAGRWPSLLSLTCPRSSGSGSELSLSSACSEYSSGSHTWAEGRGSAKQAAPGRDKRLSAGSVSSNPVAAAEQIDLRWKEGHILKGLKRLQMSSSKEASSPASAQQCKDCMTSNEDIYSLGVKRSQQGSAANQEAPSSAPFKASAGILLDFDDPDGEPSKDQSMNQTGKELLCLEKLQLQRDDDNNVHVDDAEVAEDSGHFPSPVTDNFLFLEGPQLKPGVSPTDSLNLLEEKSKDSGRRQSDRNNNQERSSDRKSRLDHVHRQQGRPACRLVSNDISSSLQHSATAGLSNESTARQRSSSMEVQQCRKQAAHSSGENKNYEFSPRKPKPEPCESARKAFILRSKSADGGPEQKHTHSPLHQKLITGQKSQGQASPPGQSSPLKSVSGTGGLSKGEKGEDIVISPGSKSLKSVQKRSPLASPVKHSKTFRPPGIKDGLKSPTKVPLQMTRHQSSNDSVDNSVYDNILCSPRKQRRQDPHCDASRSDLRPPSPPPPPPPPPGRTTSLLLRANFDNVTKTLGQAQSSSTGKVACTPPLTVALQLQQSNQAKELPAPKLAAEGKQLTDVAGQAYHSHSRIPSESQPPGPVQLSVDRPPTCRGEGGPAFILPNQSILQRSQQSVSEPKLSEVLPPTYSNVYYHGINQNLQSSISRAVKIPLPLNARSHEAISGQEASTFLVFRRQNKDDCNSTSNGVQTYRTFTCDPGEMREGVARDHTRRKIETRCNSLDSEPLVHPAPSDRDMVLDWGFDEEGWLFKRSVSVSTRPPLKPIMGMNGAKARSQSFGARYMDRPSFNRSGKVRTQIKTHSGSSLNSLSDVLPGSMSCSSSYHCPMNRSLLNNFLIEEGLVGPTPLGSSNERLQSLKHQREQARRLQIEQQFSSAFGEPVSEEPEQQSTITTIEEKVMLGIEENLQKTQEQERSIEVKQKPGSTLANWFGFRKSKLPAPSTKKADPAKLKEDKREQKITSLLGSKQTKSDKKRDRRKSDGKDCSAGRREAHDAVRACISMPCPGMSLNEIQGHSEITADPKLQMGNLRSNGENGSTVRSPNQDSVIGGLEPKKLTYIKSKTRANTSQHKERTRIQLAN